MKRPRILLADDHSLIVEGGRALLREAYDVVGFASDGKSLVDAAVHLKPDLVLLDISMPGLNGIEAARQIKKIAPQTKLVFLTMHSERVYVQAAFDAGASGYVLKTVARRELSEIIRKVLAGQLVLSADLTAVVGHIRDPRHLAKALQLSEREREVLRLIADGKSGKEIAFILGVSTKTASFHRENIKRKLAVTTTAELTQNAIALGLAAVDGPATPST